MNGSDAVPVLCVLALCFCTGVGYGVRLGVTWWERAYRVVDDLIEQDKEATNV